MLFQLGDQFFNPLDIKRVRYSWRNRKLKIVYVDGSHEIVGGVDEASADEFIDEWQYYLDTRAMCEDRGDVDEI